MPDKHPIDEAFRRSLFAYEPEVAASSWKPTPAVLPARSSSRQAAGKALAWIGLVMAPLFFGEINLEPGAEPVVAPHTQAEPEVRLAVSHAAFAAAPDHARDLRSVSKVSAGKGHQANHFEVQVFPFAEDGMSVPRENTILALSSGDPARVTWENSQMAPLSDSLVLPLFPLRDGAVSARETRPSRRPVFRFMAGPGLTYSHILPNTGDLIRINRANLPGALAPTRLSCRLDAEALYPISKHLFVTGGISAGIDRLDFSLTSEALTGKVERLSGGSLTEGISLSPELTPPITRAYAYRRRAVNAHAGMAVAWGRHQAWFRAAFPLAGTETLKAGTETAPFFTPQRPARIETGYLASFPIAKGTLLAGTGCAYPLQPVRFTNSPADMAPYQLFLQVGWQWSSP